MCIHHNPHSDPVPAPQHHIRCLPSHPRQPQNLVHRLRNLPAKLLRHHPRCAMNILSLRTKESSSPNQLLNLRQRSRRHSLRSREALEQRRSHQIHPHVRTLRAQNRSHRKLPRILVVQRAHHPRIRLPQLIQNRRHPLRSQRLTRLAPFHIGRNRLTHRNRARLSTHRRYLRTSNH